MSDDSYVTLNLLVTEFKLSAGGSGELFGFWYFSSTKTPASKAATDGFLTDLLERRSCQLRLLGTAAQIESIVRTSEHEDAKRADFAKFRSGITVGLEDVGFPAGKSWGVDVNIRATETAAVIAHMIHTRRDGIELSIASDWTIDEDLLQIFRIV